MKKPKEVNLIIKQGAPIVNDGFVYREGKGIVAIHIDLCSKYCIIDATGECDSISSIYVGTDKRSIKLDESKNGEMTEISFPDYKGWDIWSATLARYTLRVCLINKEKV
jgi:hypothetical protein